MIYRYRNDVGVSLLVDGTDVIAERNPGQWKLEQMDAFYLGGHEYLLDDDEAQILVDAGYGEYITDTYVPTL